MDDRNWWYHGDKPIVYTYERIPLDHTVIQRGRCGDVFCQRVVTRVLAPVPAAPVALPAHRLTSHDAVEAVSDNSVTMMQRDGGAAPAPRVYKEVAA